MKEKTCNYAFGNLHYQISREKFKPEPGFEGFERELAVKRR